VHEKVLPKNSKRILEYLDTLNAKSLTGWTLAGGTGLALQLGHRVSEDFDFFRSHGFDLKELHQIFNRSGKYETLQEDQNTLTVIVKGVKLSFFQISEPFLFKKKKYYFFEIADIKDIALMKLIATSSRGSKKDFVDLFVILRSGIKLLECFDLLKKKYPRGRSNFYHILKSLNYFVDAEREPLPTMLEPFQWEECKKFLIREAHQIIF